MKNLFVAAMVSIACTALYGQSFYFPAQAYADSNNLPKAIAALAKQLVPLHADMNKEENQDVLFRFKMAAEDFAGAIQSLTESNEPYKAQDPTDYNLYGYQFKTFCVAKLRTGNTSMPFSEVYLKTFDSMYNALPETSTSFANSFFDANIKELHYKLYKQLDAQKTKDSINLQDAESLCRTYNSYNVYSQVLPIALPIIAKAEKNRFIIEDSVLIKMRDGATLSAVVVRKKMLLNRYPYFIHLTFTTATAAILAELKKWQWLDMLALWETRGEEG